MKPFFAFLLAACVAISGWAQNTYAENEKYKAAQQAYKDKKYEDAQRGFEQANKALGGHCVECLLNAATAAGDAGNVSDVRKLTARAVEAASNPDDKFRALFGRASMLFRSPADPKLLAEEEEAARQALQLRPDDIAAHYAHAVALLRLEKDSEGVAELRQLLPQLPEGKDRKLVETYIADPRRTRLEFAPEFTANTGDDKAITLVELKGKVVLIDFWATWCPPCRASVPEIKELRKKYGERLLVLSVSADDDQKAWSEYIAKHDMAWLQSWDKGNEPSVLKAFRVHSFPTYLLLDGDGIVRARINGLQQQESLTYRLKPVLEKLLR